MLFPEFIIQSGCLPECGNRIAEAFVIIAVENGIEAASVAADQAPEMLCQVLRVKLQACPARHKKVIDAIGHNA